MSHKTPSWMPELFFCHRREFAVVADMLGFRIGTRRDQFDTNKTQKFLDDGFEIDFVDNKFEDNDVKKLAEIVKICEPTYTVMPDIFEQDDVENILKLGHAFEEQYDTTPIVVPKCSFDYSKIPSDWIVGFSVPSGYAETEIPITEFTDHKVHLLGGSPRSQIKYANRAVDNEIELFSVDGNAFAKASSYGNIINEPIEIIDENGYLDEKAWVKDADGYTDWGQRIATSLARYYELWRQWSMRRSDDYTNEMISKNI